MNINELTQRLSELEQRHADTNREAARLRDEIEREKQRIREHLGIRESHYGDGDKCP